MIYRKYLFPIYMKCTLGCASGSNTYTNYRHLHGLIKLSKNKHALELHSGLIGAFLNQESSNWFHPMLLTASQPTNKSSSSSNTRLPSLVVPNNNCPVEIHDKDYRYQRLMAGFSQTNNSLDLPIPTYDPDIEPLLFPDLFSSSYYHYEDSKKLVSALSIGGKTIHSAFKIRQFDSHYQTLAMENENSKIELLEFKALIIDEISR
ncbi:10085_t:CDS:2, partial [Gigaspora rosea]